MCILGSKINVLINKAHNKEEFDNSGDWSTRVFCLRNSASQLHFIACSLPGARPFLTLHPFYQIPYQVPVGSFSSASQWTPTDFSMNFVPVERGFKNLQELLWNAVLLLENYWVKSCLFKNKLDEDEVFSFAVSSTVNCLSENTLNIASLRSTAWT